MNRPGFSGGSEPCEGGSHASTEEVLGGDQGPAGPDGVPGPAGVRAAPGRGGRGGGEVGDQPRDVAGLGTAGRGRLGSAPRNVHCGCAAGGRVGARGAGTEACQRNRQGGGKFLRAGARPATAEVVEFVDKYREELGGVEPICRVLQVARRPTTRRRGGDPSIRALSSHSSFEYSQSRPHESTPVTVLSADALANLTNRLPLPHPTSSARLAAGSSALATIRSWMRRWRSPPCGAKR